MMMISICLAGQNDNLSKETSEKINLVWQPVIDEENDLSKIDKIPGVNVISPSWFVIDSEQGHIQNKIDINYLKNAREKGYKIWPLIHNDFNAEMTHKWLNDKDIRTKLIVQASLSAAVNDKGEVEKDVIEKINYITDSYEKLNTLISSIDKENNSYTRSSTNKILYLNNNDRTIKGHLENILKTYAQNINDMRTLSKILSKMQDATYFYEQGYIDPNSLTLPILRRFKFEGTPMELVTFDEATGFMMDSFLEETKAIFTDEKVYGFMEQAFGDKDRIHISEIPLVNFDAFICLILAVIKKDDENCFYYVEEIDKGKVHTDGYVVPNFEFIRKD